MYEEEERMQSSRHSSVGEVQMGLPATLLQQLSRIEGLGAAHEALEGDASKLLLQISACNELSEKLSKSIKRLDLMHTNASHALDYVENILNLKEARGEISSAIKEGDLAKAVAILTKVHGIESLSSQPTEDFLAIQEAEGEVRLLVKKEFANAIETSSVESVMSLCPLLQSLGLEDEARDDFIAFMERTVFTSISADIPPPTALDDASDVATAHAHALSQVFNTSYSIIQQYLPLVLEGLEVSMGDIIFIRKLHTKCERESGIVLKRYMKHRQIRDIILSTKTETPAAPAEVHIILDELALLIQYSSVYSKYLGQVVAGAESRIRKGVPTSEKVFTGPTDFTFILEELINRYYVEGEKWLMQTALRTALQPSSSEEGRSSRLDEAFFVLQRCAQRSLASHNIDVATAVLGELCALLTGNLLSQAAELASAAVTRASSAMSANMNRHYRLSDTTYNPETDVELSSVNITRTLQALYSTASSLGGPTESNEAKLSAATEAFGTIATCARYIERIGKDSVEAGQELLTEGPTVAEDTKKLTQCKESFNTAIQAFQRVLQN